MTVLEILSKVKFIIHKVVDKNRDVTLSLEVKTRKGIYKPVFVDDNRKRLIREYLQGNNFFFNIHPKRVKRSRTPVIGSIRV